VVTAEGTGIDGARRIQQAQGGRWRARHFAQIPGRDPWEFSFEGKARTARAGARKSGRLRQRGGKGNEFLKLKIQPATKIRPRPRRRSAWQKARGTRDSPDFPPITWATSSVKKPGEGWHERRRVEFPRRISRSIPGTTPPIEPCCHYAQEIFGRPSQAYKARDRGGWAGGENCSARTANAGRFCPEWLTAWPTWRRCPIPSVFIEAVPRQTRAHHRPAALVSRRRKGKSLYCGLQGSRARVFPRA